MRAFKLLSALMLALLSVGAQAQCQPQQSVRFAVIPKKSMEALVQEYQPLVNHLTAVLGLPVEMVSASSYEGVVDAIVSGGVDIAFLGPASYLLAYQRDPHIEPFASLTISQGHFTPAGHYYQALLLRRSEEGSLESLRNKQVALSDPASTSGSIVPRVAFASQVSMPLERFFQSVVYTGSHDNSLDALLEKRVDAAFVASVRVDAYLKAGRITPKTFKVLWKSEPIYYDPYVFSSHLCPEYKERIREAMLGDSQALATFLASQNATGFTPVSHAEYAPLLPMMQFTDSP